jgi:hypothetical protein
MIAEYLEKAIKFEGAACVDKVIADL